VRALLPWCGELRFPLDRLQCAEEGLDDLEPLEAGALPRQKRARMGLCGVFQELEQQWWHIGAHRLGRKKRRERGIL
jgi:hypothetical protein